MYTCQVQKSVQEMKNLQKMLEVTYETLFKIKDHVKGSDQWLQRWAQTLTSITAVVDQVKKAPHPLIFWYRIKIEMMSFSYDTVLEFIYKKDNSRIHAIDNMWEGLARILVSKFEIWNSLIK